MKKEIVLKYHSKRIINNKRKYLQPSCDKVIKTEQKFCGPAKPSFFPLKTYEALSCSEKIGHSVKLSFPQQ